MNTYLIKYIGTKVSISEFEDDRFISLKNKGEESWEFQDSSFWAWFKNKIEYNNEELSFIIVSDDYFEIDNEISIASTHHIELDYISKIINENHSKGVEVRVVPTLGHVNIPQVMEEESEKTDKNSNKTYLKTTIEDVYKKKTEEYKNE